MADVKPPGRLSLKRQALFSVEPLENRVLMSTVVVTNNNNDSGSGSLRDAIATAVDGDTIDLTAVTGTISFGSEIDITHGITITGPEANVLSLDGGNATQLFVVDTSQPVSVSGLKFASIMLT
jgi:hypothetical protein